MKKVKKRYDFEKSMSRLLTVPRTNYFQKIASGWAPTKRGNRMRKCKNFQKSQNNWQDSISSKQV